MMNALNTERTKYEQAWATREYREGITEADRTYGCRSLQLWMEARQDFPPIFESALDIGCGRGLLFDIWNMQGIDAWAVDIAENSLDDAVRKRWSRRFMRSSIWNMHWDRRFEVGVCADVMEHIPPEYVHESLCRIAGCCDEVLFKIANQQCVWRGSFWHLTVQPPEWGLSQMQLISGSAERLKPAGTGGNSDGHRTIRWRPA